MRRLLHATLFAAVMAAAGVLSVAGVLADLPGRPYALAFLDQFVHAVAINIVVVAIIGACEKRAPAGLRRVAIQSAALSLGVTASAYSIAWIAESQSLIRDMGDGSTEGLVPNFLWFGFAGAVLFSWYYAVRERAARAIDSLAEESVLRHAALRRADEARLKALLAQVDPALLDAKLAGIQTAFRDGGEAGDRMLDELIDHLTEALRNSRGGLQPQGESDGGFPAHPA
jgi:hypothetical protein